MSDFVRVNAPRLGKCLHTAKLVVKSAHSYSASAAEVSEVRSLVADTRAQLTMLQDMMGLEEVVPPSAPSQLPVHPLSMRHWVSGLDKPARRALYAAVMAELIEESRDATS